MIGTLGGAGGLGWSHSNEEKVFAAAMLYSVNKVATQTQALSAKELPPGVPIKKANN